jgi:hypothetical protein
MWMSGTESEMVTARDAAIQAMDNVEGIPGK